jgi:hypothetical protein
VFQCILEAILEHEKGKPADVKAKST